MPSLPVGDDVQEPLAVGHVVVVAGLDGFPGVAGRVGHPGSRRSGHSRGALVPQPVVPDFSLRSGRLTIGSLMTLAVLPAGDEEDQGAAMPGHRRAINVPLATASSGKLRCFAVSRIGRSYGITASY